MSELASSSKELKVGEMSRGNRFLIVQASVVLTASIDRVIVSMDKYFEQANLKAIVTSGFRTPEHQLDIIRQYLTAKGLNGKYQAAMNCHMNDQNPDGTFVWQMGWSNLLNIGVIINPPVAAKVLMDYARNGKNLIGKTIPASLHSLGLAFNIGGGGNGVADEAAVVQKAVNDKLEGLNSFLIERENNAVHCNCDSLVSDVA